MTVPMTSSCVKKRTKSSLWFVCLLLVLPAADLQAQASLEDKQIPFTLHKLTLPQDQDNPLLQVPRDLAFHPEDENELWVVNRGAPYRVSEDGSYLPNAETSCQWRYGVRTTPPETSRFWPSFAIIRDPAADKPEAENRVDPWAIHFLAEASSIDFGAGHFSPHYHGPSEVTDSNRPYLSFGTCGESRNEMKGCADWNNGRWNPSTPLDFQGPTLWSTDPQVFANKNEVADVYLVRSFCSGSDDTEACMKQYLNPVCPDDNQACETGEAGKPFTLGSHLDMLHESPMCMGLAWEKQNRYSVFDGCGGAQFKNDRLVVDGHGENFNMLQNLDGRATEEDPILPECKGNGDIVRYDFRVDHGAGFDDHCDGIIERFAIGKVKRVENVPSHMVMWQENLFIADSGNGRIARLNPKDAGGRRDYNQNPLSERVHNACTVVWDMENAENDDVLFSYFDFKNTGPVDDAPIPSGMAIFPSSALPDAGIDEDLLLVGDNYNSRLMFVSLNVESGEAGELVGVIDLGDEFAPGSIMGLDVQPGTNHIYLADAVGNSIWRIELTD